MIIHTGARTDTVRFYTDWLLRRFEEGYVLSRNPMFPTHVSHLRLDPHLVDCVVFCSKDYQPILDRLHRITDEYNTFFFYTITAYGDDVEPQAPSIDDSIGTLLRLEQQVGAQRIAWRYDPVLLTRRYTVERHLETFDAMAARLVGHVDRCVFSFVEIDEMVRRNMPGLLLFKEGQKRQLAEGLGAIARRYGLPLQSCAETGDWSECGIAPSGCLSRPMLEQANGIALKPIARDKLRPECGCIASRAIGDYNTCPGGCQYCHATRRRDVLRRNLKRHDPESPLLIGHLQESDQVAQSDQRSFRIFQDALF